ncbi:MAG: hypothetical protein R3B13_22095 [Polyangiaceae bacterium]
MRRSILVGACGIAIAVGMVGCGSDDDGGGGPADGGNSGGGSGTGAARQAAEATAPWAPAARQEVAASAAQAARPCSIAVSERHRSNLKLTSLCDGAEQPHSGHSFWATPSGCSSPKGRGQIQIEGWREARAAASEHQ